MIIGVRDVRRAIIFILLISIQYSYGQENENKQSSVYKVNKKIEIPITVGLFVANYFGIEYIYDKPLADSLTLMQLNPNDIWKFDRVATQQDPAFVNQAHNLSDLFMNLTIAAPVFLALDKEIRRDWLDLLVIYTESHAINTSIYVISAGLVDRYRPFMYHSETPYEDKTGTGTQVSFYSGHVSTTATASFFIAKVYSDYHPELGNKKLWLYAAALITPTLVGYYRVKAMKHFPTDVIVGGVVGAAAGILIPHLHKNKKKSGNFSFIPFAGGFSGLKIKYAIP